MASIAEVSEASLSLRKIERLQQQFLQAPGHAPQQSNVNDDGEASNGSASDNDKHKRDAEIPESAANTYRTPVSSPTSTNALKVPRLESAKSAPPAEMEAMIYTSPSQEAFQGFTRASSFPGFEGGDTQPMESQEVRQIRESMAMSRTTDATTPRKEKKLMQISPDGKVEYTYDTNVTTETPRTLREGDTGYMDLAGAWEKSSLAGGGSPSELGESVNDDEGSPVVELREEEVFRKPAMPETPSLAGHKRRRSGEMVTSEPSSKKTPGLSQFFAFKRHDESILSRSQAYNQTQAPSSPPGQDTDRSDPVITRPSPNIHNTVDISSPTVMSSPIYNRAPPASTAEPREKYTSMEESQKRKRERLQADFGLRRESGDGDEIEAWLDEDDDSMRRRVSNQQLRRAHSDQALDQLTRVRAPSRPGSRPHTSSSPRKGTLIDLRTPATTKKLGEVADFEPSQDGEVSDDEPVVEDKPGVQDEPLAHNGPIVEVGPVVEDEPIVEDEAMTEDVIAEDGRDDDEQSEQDVYDEFAQTVLRSQGPRPEDEDDDDGNDGPADVEDEDDVIDDTNDQQEDAAPQEAVIQDSSQQDRAQPQRRSQTSTQRSAIADSQPFNNEVQRASASQKNDQSPSCSYVPGSQYAGKTSQDQAHLPTKPVGRLMGPPALSASNQQAMPSSPPVAAVDNSASIDNTEEASLERKKMLARFQAEQQDTEEHQAEQEIPESDLPATDNGSSRPATAEDRPNTESNNAPFSTARSHTSTMNPSPAKPALPPPPLKKFASQHSTADSQSPRTKAGVRRFAEIAGAPSPPRGSGETQEVDVDVDAVMTDLISIEDREFLEVTSSPPKERAVKRRRTGRKSSMRELSPVKGTRAKPMRPKPKPGKTVAEDLPPVEAEDPVEPQGDVDNFGVRALQNSPSKANEQRLPSPEPENTSESVKRMEQAGSKAASQLLSKRGSKVAKPERLSGIGRKAGSKLQQETKPPEEKKVYGKKTKADRTPKAKDAPPPEPEPTETAVTVEETADPEIEEPLMDVCEDGQDAETEQQTEEGKVVAPHRIFALFKGNYNSFYPATWLSASLNGAGHRVKFDDGTTTSIETHLVGRLELALGDQVKVDIKGMKNKVWIIKGFGAALPAERATQVLTDIYGHETVKVQAKSTRNSVSGPNAVAQGEGEVFNVAIEVVYLTHSMWTHFSSRQFQPGAGNAMAAARLATPSTSGGQTPIDAETPTSRSRRALASTTKGVYKRGSFVRDDSAATSSRSPIAGLFHGMAFAVSYGQNETEKQNVTRLIQRNGGTILHDGFEGLFNAPSLDDIDPTSLSKKSAQKTYATKAHAPGLQLKPEHKHLGFVALIADRHSRRAKYIQALALGLPTLSGRWVMDCLDTAKNPLLSGPDAAPLPWTKYLFAAGESAYLNGAIRSRDLAGYDASSAPLAKTIEARPCLLEGDGVLIVASKKNKAVWERRKAFAFLTLALGAGSVKRVADLQEARALVEAEGEKWRFVYVDGSVAEASAAVFGKGGGAGGPGGGKKRKRNEKVVDAKALSVSDGRVRVVGDEFVVQSLILGGLAD